MNLTPLAALFIAASLAPAARADDTPPALKVATRINVERTHNRELPTTFDGRPFLISLNTNLPGVERVKSNLIASLTGQKFLDKVVLEYFSPTQRLDFVVVKIGTRVPLELAQSALRSVAALPDAKIMVSLQGTDAQLGNTQRIYIGSLSQRTGKAVNRDELQALLDPKLDLAGFQKLLPHTDPPRQRPRPNAGTNSVAPLKTDSLPAGTNAAAGAVRP